MGIDVSDYPRLIVGTWSVFENGSDVGTATYSGSGGSGTYVLTREGMINILANREERQWRLSGNQIYTTHFRLSGGLVGVMKSIRGKAMGPLAGPLDAIVFHGRDKTTDTQDTINFTDANHFTVGNSIRFVRK